MSTAAVNEQECDCSILTHCFLIFHQWKQLELFFFFSCNFNCLLLYFSFCVTEKNIKLKIGLLNLMKFLITFSVAFRKTPSFVNAC